MKFTLVALKSICPIGAMNLFIEINFEKFWKCDQWKNF